MEAVLAGRVLVGDSALTSGTVVLHRVSDTIQGQIDSTAVGPDGTFVLPLPGLPSRAAGEAYFASVMHQGVVYFGSLIDAPIQLDSVYVIQTWDTVVAPPEGADVALQARSLFIEPGDGSWVVTDVFQLRNDLDRTIVAPPGGRVWSYPLVPSARDVRTEGEMFSNVASFEGGTYNVRAALPPGERVFVVQYALDSLLVSFPTPGLTEALDVLVREPAPALDFVGLTRVESVEMDAGETFRRYAAENLSVPFVQVLPGEEASAPPVRWIAVAVALAITVAALLALYGGPRAAGAPRPAVSRAERTRREILLRIARLDEEFERSGSRSEAEKLAYRREREELLRRLRSGR
ncbi:MAG TPA: hypothetical protein VFQ22_01675 [Longimicrobiales bacterium]|nr:hypothetical protein [Longimicrobiales bacterium]